MTIPAWLTGRFGVEREAMRAARPLPESPVQRVPVLDAPQCAEICANVHALRPFWTPREGKPCGFFTLGQASYFDCRDPRERREYLRRASDANALLRARFAPLYEAVRRALEAALAEPCALTESYALPGFHIWLSAGVPRLDLFGRQRGAYASVHFDLQYQLLEPGRGAPPTAREALSFTLPLRLPCAGGGLNLWDIDYADFLAAAARDRDVTPQRMSRSKPARRVVYAVGELVLHSGHALHQIAPVRRVRAGDERISLQGHALRTGEGWSLYW
ncbi:MAG TPA: hypothetical protein VKY65_02180 [Alphaproteobacteria bacterium]|nr:hypothetical protein [Alphaproteobacteria bacterium]